MELGAAEEGLDPAGPQHRTLHQVAAQCKSLRDQRSEDAQAYHSKVRRCLARQTRSNCRYRRETRPFGCGPLTARPAGQAPKDPQASLFTIRLSIIDYATPPRAMI